MSKNLKLMIDIVLIGLILMLVSFIPEHARDFFGDWKCQGSGTLIEGKYMIHYTGCNYSSAGFHDAAWHWGFRHWVWMVMGAALTITRVIGLVKKYDANI